MVPSSKPISTQPSRYFRSPSTGARPEIPTRGSRRPTRSRRAERCLMWASAASVVSTPSRRHTKASFLIWDIRGLCPGPYFRSCSSTHQVVRRRITSAGRAR